MIGIVYSYLPFMVLPLYANLERLDFTLNEASMDLGSRPWRVFLDITLPLSIPGIIAGGLLVFIPASGEFVIPSLVGDASDPMIGRVIGAEDDWEMRVKWLADERPPCARNIKTCARGIARERAGARRRRIHGGRDGPGQDPRR